MNSFRRQWLGFAVACALLAGGLLPWLSAHACCMEPASGHGIALGAASEPMPVMACCEAPPQKLSATGSPATDDSTGLSAITAGFTPAHQWQTTTQPVQTARLAKIFHKDNSRRHLELSVLLN